jgi:sarcosine oxidase, subunit alpha
MDRIDTAIAVSPVEPWHLAHGARMLTQDGWRIPTAYSEPAVEVDAARNRFAIADLSSLAKLSVRGKDLVRSLLSKVALEWGRVAVLPKLGFAAALTEDHCLLLSTSVRNPFNDLLKDLPGYTADLIFDVTSNYTGIGLFGPDHERGLRALTSFNVASAAFSPGSCAETGLAGVHAILIRPPGSVAATFIYVAQDVGEYMWERLHDAAGENVLVPMGLDAFGTLWSL